MVATGQSQIFTNSLPILLNCLSLNTYTLSALLFLMGKGRPGVPARTKGSVIGTGLHKGHEAKGNWNLAMNADGSGHWNTVSESNNHTWSKKLQVGMDLKAQTVSLTELKKTLRNNGGQKGECLCTATAAANFSNYTGASTIIGWKYKCCPTNKHTEKKGLF